MLFTILLVIINVLKSDIDEFLVSGISRSAYDAMIEKILKRVVIILITHEDIISIACDDAVPDIQSCKRESLISIFVGKGQSHATLRIKRIELCPPTNDTQSFKELVN